jgi:hypothetical protein
MAEGLLLIEEEIEDYELAASNAVSMYVSPMIHRLARIAAQVEVLQNVAMEWFKLVGVRDHEGFGVSGLKSIGAGAAGMASD